MWLITPRGGLARFFHLLRSSPFNNGRKCLVNGASRGLFLVGEFKCGVVHACLRALRCVNDNVRNYRGCGEGVLYFQVNFRSFNGFGAVRLKRRSVRRGRVKANVSHLKWYLLSVANDCRLGLLIYWRRFWRRSVEGRVVRGRGDMLEVACCGVCVQYRECVLFDRGAFGVVGRFRRPLFRVGIELPVRLFFYRDGVQPTLAEIVVEWEFRGGIEVEANRFRCLLDRFRCKGFTEIASVRQSYRIVFHDRRACRPFRRVVCMLGAAYLFSISVGNCVFV